MSSSINQSDSNQHINSLSSPENSKNSLNEDSKGIPTATESLPPKEIHKYANVISNDIISNETTETIDESLIVDKHATIVPKSEKNTAPPTTIAYRLAKDMTEVEAEKVFGHFANNVDNLLDDEWLGMGGRDGYSFFLPDIEFGNLAKSDGKVANSLQKLIIKNGGELEKLNISATPVIGLSTTISRAIPYNGQELRTMTATLTKTIQLKNINEVDIKIAEVENTNTFRYGLASNFSITATDSRLKDIAHKRASTPTLDRPGDLQVGEMMSLEVGDINYFASEVLIQKHLAKGKINVGKIETKEAASTGFFGEISDIDRSYRKITVRKGLSPNGSTHLIVSTTSIESNLDRGKVGGVLSGTLKFNDRIIYGEATQSLGIGASDGTRNGAYIELDPNNKEHMKIYAKIIKTGKIPSSLLKKNDSVIASGFINSQYESNDLQRFGVWYGVSDLGMSEGNKNQLAYTDRSRLDVQHETNSIYDVVNTSDNSMLSKKTKFFIAENQGVDVADIQSNTIKETVNTKTHNHVSVIDTTIENQMISNGESKVETIRFKDIKAARVNENHAVNVFRQQARSKEKGEAPIFESVKLKLLDGKILTGNDAADYLESHGPRKGWFDTEDQLVVTTNHRKGNTIAAMDNIAEDYKKYRSNHQSFNEFIGFSAYSGSPTLTTETYNKTNEEISTNLINNNFGDGKIFEELKTIKNDAGREESYPLHLVYTIRPLDAVETIQ